MDLDIHVYLCMCVYVCIYVCMYVSKYTSQFLTSCEDHANFCWLKDLLTCGRKDCLAAQEHFGVLVLL